MSVQGCIDYLASVRNLKSKESDSKQSRMLDVDHYFEEKRLQRLEDGLFESESIYLMGASNKGTINSNVSLDQGMVFRSSDD